jgi:tRNA-dihydrouridine synthase
LYFITILKKHLTWYAHGLEGAASFRGKINMLDSASEIMKIMNEFLIKNPKECDIMKKQAIIV